MERTQVKDDLITIINPYIQDKELLKDVSESSNLINDLNINSAHIVDIVLDIEEKYDIMIDDDAISQMGTVGESIDLVLEKLETS